MKIIYTEHAIKKFADLKRLGLTISSSLVKETVKNPVYLDETTDFPKKIAHGILDQNHILRVVYRQESDIIVVITFYPTGKGRYSS